MNFYEKKEYLQGPEIGTLNCKVKSVHDWFQHIGLRNAAKDVQHKRVQRGDTFPGRSWKEDRKKQRMYCTFHLVT